jgi:hypothetical protein
LWIIPSSKDLSIFRQLANCAREQSSRYALERSAAQNPKRWGQSECARYG